MYGMEGPRSTNNDIHHGQYLPLNHCLRKHVKPKKQHEILQLGKTLSLLGDATECKDIVDVGAGQGHLSRLLTFEHGFKVTTVEAAGGHAPKAQKFDRDAQLHIIKKRQKLNNCNQSEDVISDSNAADLPDHVTCFIQSDASRNEFLQIVQNSLSRDREANQSVQSTSTSNLTNSEEKLSCDNYETTFGIETRNDDVNSHYLPCVQNNKNRSATGNNRKSRDVDNVEIGGSGDNGRQFILTGLHACGDLTATMLRVFATCPDIVGLGSVGCCYMKLSENSSNSEQDVGYPMSRFLRRHPHHHLSYEAKEMACHFVDNYISRLKGNQPGLKLHCYRAALQCIIRQLDPSFDHGTIKLNIKNAQDLDFRQYARMGLRRLGLTNDIPDNLWDKAESYLPLWKAAAAFYTLRLSLAPVVETLILLDRVMYLQEFGIPSALVPIFEPSLSPRNFVLLARKTTVQPTDR